MGSDLNAGANLGGRILPVGVAPGKLAYRLGAAPARSGPPPFLWRAEVRLERASIYKGTLTRLTTQFATCQSLHFKPGKLTMLLFLKRVDSTNVVA